MPFYTGPLFGGIPEQFRHAVAGTGCANAEVDRIHIIQEALNER
jgi:hypothetical protein